MYQHDQKQSTNYGVAGAINQPKEIGILQRVEGLKSGLNELNLRIANFRDRVYGSPPSAGANALSGAPIGIYGNLSEAEETLRSCLSMLDDLHNKF